MIQALIPVISGAGKLVQAAEIMRAVSADSASLAGNAVFHAPKAPRALSPRVVDTEGEGEEPKVRRIRRHLKGLAPDI